MIDGEKEDNTEYKEKDIVWAKVKGYPWWPSIITHISFRNNQVNGENIKEKIYTIEFIGEKNNAKVTREKIESFNKNYELHTNTKNPILIKSIELAKKNIEKKQNSKIIFLKENTQDNINKKEKDINKENSQNIPTKKSHESSEEQSKNEKESDKNINLLQRKRINDHVILDENDEGNSNMKNLDIKNKEEKKILSSPKNNIKINININLTTNNQNMVNINSFHSTDLNQNNQNIISNINYSSLSSNENNNINKITNNNKNNNLNEILNLNGESIVNYLEKENNKDGNKNDLNNEEKNDKNNSKEESFEEEDEFDEENDNEIITNDEINEIIQKLLNGQIQISNISSQKMVTTELTKLSEKLNELFAKNQDLEIYHLTKYLIPILITFTYNKNNDILIKSSEILSFLNEKIINEIFVFSSKEKENLIESLNNEKEKNKDKGINLNEIEENDFKEGLNIIEMINAKNLNKSNISEHQHISYSKRGRPKKNNMGSEISSEYFNSKIGEGCFSIKETFNLNDKNVYEDFLRIITCKDKDKMENYFTELSINFFSNVYDKFNKDLDKETAKLRRKFCKKIFIMVHKLYPEIKLDFLKKVIIYFEHKIRNDNSNLDKSYFNKINTLFDIVKERLYYKTK